MTLTVDNKPQRTGLLILAIGVALLAFTFINAFMFLQAPFTILAAGDLGSVFGEALAPLIQACIRLMYLGIMGWIGSMLTIRGIPLVTHKPVTATAPAPAPQQPHPEPEVPSQPKQTPQQVKADTPSQAPKAPPAQSPSPLPTSRQEEPRAILIPPENQKEE